MKLLFVFNPHSGKGQIGMYLSRILDTFTKAGYDVTARPTQGRLDAFEYVRLHGKEYDRIVASGGDGTLTEITRALMTFGENDRPPLGYIPSGTTNDFAATLGIPKVMTDAAQIAVSGRPFKCDIGTFNGTPFNYVAAFGAFTDVSYDTPQDTKNAIGHAAYILEGIKRLSNLPSYHVNIKYEGGEIDEEVFLCLILNATSVGGVLSTERLMNVDLCDGMFEMLVFRQPTKAIELQAVLAGLMRGEASGEGYSMVRSSRFEITSREDIKWTLDGEFGGEVRNAEVDVVPSAITYIVSSF